MYIKSALLINDQAVPAETSVFLPFFEIVTLFRVVFPYAVPRSPRAATRTGWPGPPSKLNYVQVNLFLINGTQIFRRA